MDRQAVDKILKNLAARANARLPIEEHIHLSAHILRHTFLKRVADKKGVHKAHSVSGHASYKHIWRYVTPGDQEKADMVEELF